MDNCIYHSKDLDGLMSGAIVHNYQTSYWEPCVLHPYDYGENLDTRKFKGKSTVMIDVSLPMDRMELLSTSCQQFMWLDHHLSAYDDLIKYCKEKEYEIQQHKINDLILCTEVKKMNLTYYYSSRLSGCEIASIMFSKNLSPLAKKVIQLLGQYDTWRQFDDNKFLNDDDWEKTVMPFQFGFRAKFNDPVKISDYIETLNSQKPDITAESILEPICDFGKSVLDYQSKLDEVNVRNNSFEMDFEFQGKSLKAICLNSTVFNSAVFKSTYYDGYHDLMLAFQYSGKTDKYKFSLYTTKSEIDILSIAKSLGGGGHLMACGFEVPANKILIDKKIISIFRASKTFSADVGHLEFTEDPVKDLVESFEGPKVQSLSPEDIADALGDAERFSQHSPPVVNKKGYMEKFDQDDNQYIIPIAYSKRFETALAEMIETESREDFDKNYLKYKI